MLRVVLRVLIGMVLGGALSFLIDPFLSMVDAFGFEGVFWFALVFLGYAAAFGIGWISGRFEILVAAVSVWLGTVVVVVVVGNAPLFELYAAFYGGVYPIFALLGGAVAYARRYGSQEQLEKGDSR